MWIWLWRTNGLESTSSTATTILSIVRATTTAAATTTTEASFTIISTAAAAAVGAGNDNIIKSWMSSRIGMYQTKVWTTIVSICCWSKSFCLTTKRVYVCVCGCVMFIECECFVSRVTGGRREWYHLIGSCVTCACFSSYTLHLSLFEFDIKKNFFFVNNGTHTHTDIAHTLLLLWCQWKLSIND